MVDVVKIHGLGKSAYFVDFKDEVFYKMYSPKYPAPNAKSEVIPDAAVTEDIIRDAITTNTVAKTNAQTGILQEKNWMDWLPG